MANLVNTGLGGSKTDKEKAKGLYWDPPLMTPGSGIAFEFREINTVADYNCDVNNVPWANKTRREMVISTEGYTGEVEISGTTFTIVNGVITSVSS